MQLELIEGTENTSSSGVAGASGGSQRLLQQSEKSRHNILFNEQKLTTFFFPTSLIFLSRLHGCTSILDPEPGASPRCNNTDSEDDGWSDEEDVAKLTQQQPSRINELIAKRYAANSFQALQFYSYIHRHPSGRNQLPLWLLTCQWVGVTRCPVLRL